MAPLYVSTAAALLRVATSLGGAVGGLNYKGAWQATTAYALDDLVTYAGDAFVVTTAHTSGSAFGLTNLAVLTAPPGTYNVKWYGAKGDGVTDDTAAINATISAAFAAEAGVTNQATVLFPAGIYQCASATTQSATFKGNAQIPIPLSPVAGVKFVWVFKGTRGEPLPHWQQTSAQTAGAVIRSTLTGQTVSGTWGPPSVIGGPTPAQGYGESAALYNNVLVVVDDIKVVVPANPTVLGFDFSGCAEIDFTGSVNATTTPGLGEPTAPTNSWAIGLYAPQRANNDLVLIRDFSCEGMYVGLALSEHATVLHAQIIYCIIGIDVLTSIDYLRIVYASVEVCHFSLQCEAVGTGLGKVIIDMLDCEDTNAGSFAPGFHINDPSNLLRGTINVHRQSPSAGTDAVPLVNGGANVRIYNASTVPGTVTAPGVPSSTTPLQNPFWRDAVVTVTGGTVSAVAVDGVAQGYAATGFTVTVPSGKNITLTYTGTPTWKWVLL